jgi:hypothetical protein
MDNDIIDISLDFENLDRPRNNSKSVNFGSGIELLMNGNKKDMGKQTSDIAIDDLENLENELNNLSNVNTISEPDSDPFNIDLNLNDDKPSVAFNDSINIGMGKSTADTYTDTKTWDGYGKFNNIPVNPDKFMSSEPKLTKEELLREKFKYLRRLEALEKKGVELTKKYTMDSNLMEMQGEYEMIMEEKTRLNSVKFQGNMMMMLVNGIEFLNNRFDPFDVKLDGWGEQLNENINDYDDVFGELYEKYKSKATLAPELKLLFQLGGSAAMIHMTNTMFKSAMPGMDDIMRQNPDLMRHFQTAAVNSMAGSNPGFSGFMNSVANPPPPPMATQGPNAIPPPQNRGGNNLMGQSMGRSSFQDDGISIKESFGINGLEPPQKTRRPEMKGPSDMSDILSGLKTRTINVEPARQQQQQQQQSQSPSNQFDVSDANGSTISINDLKDLQSDANVPKRTRRKPKSDKNTVSLDM